MPKKTRSQAPFEKKAKDELNKVKLAEELNDNAADEAKKSYKEDDEAVVIPPSQRRWCQGPELGVNVTRSSRWNQFSRDATRPKQEVSPEGKIP